MRAPVSRQRRLFLAAAGAATLGTAVAANDQGAAVQLHASGPIKSAVVIASGGDDEGCYAHLAAAGTDMVHLGRGVSEAACPSEVAVQAQDYGMVLDTQPIWVSKVTKTELPPRVTLKLNLRVPNVTGLAQMAEKQVDLADTLLNHNRAGLTLSLTGGKPQLYTTGGNSSDATIIGAGCAAVDGLIKSDPAKGLYDPAAINVYYVGAILTDAATPLQGYTCFEWGAPNVIYVSYDALDNILAHELGHALGLQYGNGHVNGLAGFGSRNLMMSSQSANSTVLQDHWTTGQVYRMNADTRSVLNTLFGIGKGATAFRVGIKRVCQENPAATSPCPPLAFEGP
jgi:hypothetical protein